MRALLARVSILSVCVLAVSAATARGQSPQSSTSEDSKIKIFGAVKLDVIYNETRPQAPGVPFFLVPKFVGKD